jgi:superfamily II DNA or RNA helicase
MKEYFPNTSVGIYHSKEKILGDIMIVVIHSACGAEEYVFPDEVTKDINGKTIRKPVKFTVAEFFNRFGFVIFDESHKYCSPEFSKVYTRCQSMYMLGLSATPGERQDGFDPLTYWHVGQLVDIATLIPNLLQDEPFNTKILGIKYSGSPEYTAYKSNDHGMFDNNATLIQMMEDPHRLDIIIPILEFLNEQKRNIYIFSDRLEYLNIIRRELFERLRKSGSLIADTLDCDLIKFMREKPDYKTYVQNLQTEIKDRYAKYAIYEKAGVSYFLLINPETEMVQLFVLEDGEYILKQEGHDFTYRFDLDGGCSAEIDFNEIW